MYKLNMFGVTRLSDGASIPTDESNRDYAEYLQWVSEGNQAEVDEVSPPMIIGGDDAKRWRNDELARADVILNRLQDGEKGLGTQKAWREYRIALRNWPDAKDFPSEDSKPTAPDAE